MPTAATMTESAILPVLSACVLEILPDVAPVEITPENSLLNLGLNSLERTEVIMATLDELELRIPLTAFSKAENIGGILAVIASHGA
ncbi:phosphopantetheine-binding protein [Breoghania sp. L-A4]|uniref:phosphopantetheine-binding protein n=1 Tax=Breoghania sp. L-A4 TaxID=2304600 RepID=UPI000E35D611|nr:phosphopantetheine-binding protein [Breoghania sp. L-A4]AXS40791.1 acyl carrier protein [Breoghania sp. L-A4]